MKKLSFALALVSIAVASNASASTGVCDSNPPTSTDACISAIQNSGGVVNDIFKDANGLTATQLPVYGQLVNQWPNCPDLTTFAGCAGISNPPYDCPGEYTCVAGVANTFENTSARVNALDHLWWHPCRLADDQLQNGCPIYNTANCIPDGTGGNYDPWEGLVFDLGGPSNQVVIFAMNDHGPQPCESTEYTVFLSDNPYAQTEILHPATDGVDPQQWNRAVLSKIFTEGWQEVRPPDPTGHAACGDTAQYSVEDDSFVTVYSLPCGINFRYAAIVAGNDGLDFPECAYDSQEAELDAVAGLTESGTAVCPDADGDHYVDCNCMGAPKVCDCDDTDPTVHPGAPEKCDDPDKNCDGVPGSCPGAQVCYDSICLDTCGGENPTCPAGETCGGTPKGELCVPTDCSVGGCPAGSVCINKQCLPACTNVVCPGDMVCQQGQCVDVCAGVECPPGESCVEGVCQPPCNCYAQNIGCMNQTGTVCDVGSSNTCVAPACVGVTCPTGETCDPTSGTCVSFCNKNVKCPEGQKCVAPTGCVPLCDGVTCPGKETCDPTTGKCVDHSCDNVTCFAPEVCVDGKCVETDGGASGGASSSGSSGKSSSASGKTTSASSGAGGNGGAGGGDEDIGAKGGCGCRVADDRSPASAGAILALCFAIGARRRRSASVRSNRAG